MSRKVERTPGELVVATYNVHGGVGSDRRFDPQRIRRVLQELGGDIVALQEVRHPSADPPGSEHLAWIGHDSGYNGIMGPTLVDGRGPYGNLLLTRFAVREVRRHLLPGRGEPRGAIDAILEDGKLVLRVLATHLGLGQRARELQAERLCEELERGPQMPVLLLGDLNDWRPWSRTLRELERRVGHAPRPRSFPARFPLFGLDRVMVRPQEALLDARAHASRLARKASDHLPVVARLAREPLERASNQAP